MWLPRRPPGTFDKERAWSLENRPADYFNFICDCGRGPMTIAYLGLDTVVPRIHLTCKECGKATYYKIGGVGTEGFHHAPAGRDRPLNPETLQEYPPRES